jgi:hypothetical protein
LLIEMNANLGTFGQAAPLNKSGGVHECRSIAHPLAEGEHGGPTRSGKGGI